MVAAPPVLRSNDPALAEDGRAKFVIDAGTRICDFIMSSRPVDVIEGPIGSGKTKALCARIMRHAQEQMASPIDGIRRTRWAFVRNTYPDLKRTTIRTWLEVVPEHVYGRMNMGQPPSHRIRFGDVDLEVDFLALDKDEDIRKLRSTEYTGIVFNELAFIEKSLFDEADSRLRFPPAEHGGPTWRGVFADTNAPDEDHWLAIMTGQVDAPPGMTADELASLVWPQGWGFHKQPPALIERLDQHGRILGYDINPHAENLRNLPSDYYQRMLSGKTKPWIDSHLMVRVTLVVEGSPVWPMFRREFHVAASPLKPVEGHEVLVWLDFGRVYPAALFAQALNDRIYVQYEMLGFNEGATIFAPKVKRFLEQHYPGHSFRMIGDPKGNDKGQATEHSAFDVFRNVFGAPVTPAPVKQNDISTRIEAVAYVLNDNPSGQPRLVISPYCRTLIVGAAGRYHLVREEDGELRPRKDRYSNLCDCLQYGVLGLGEGRRMIGLSPANLVKPFQAYRRRESMRRISA